MDAAKLNDAIDRFGLLWQRNIRVSSRRRALAVHEGFLMERVIVAT